MIAVGQKLGGYTVQRRIGGGQMGEVFLAQHRRIARRAAIKALIPDLSDKEPVIEHFFKEARNTSLITHPGIVGILDCDVHEGQAYVVMDFLQGESLGTYLKRNGTLASDLAFALGVVAQVAAAVGAAHEARIMHRGLKPENIYLHLGSPVDPTVSVKVLDFGVAQLSREDGGMSQTRSGILLGTPTYMSPEQCRGVGYTDARSDVYSLGCVLYEVLCGRPPFESGALGDVILAHVTEPPEPPVKLVPELLPQLNSLILKMLAKTPEERPESMSQVVEALRICARALDIDFERALQPVTPVERPDYGAALPSPAWAPLPPSVPLPAPLPPFAARTPRRVPKTMILGEEPLEPAVVEQLAAHAQQVAAAAKGAPAGKVEPAAKGDAIAPREKVEARDPLARLNALAGETMILPEGKGTPLELRARAVELARAREPALPRALVGGTQVMPVSKVPVPRRQAPSEYHAPSAQNGEQADDEDRGHDQRDQESGGAEPLRETEQAVANRRVARVPARVHGVSDDAAAAARALLQSAARLWQERPRLILVVAGGVVLVGLVLAATVPMSSGSPSRSKARSPAAGASSSSVGAASPSPPARSPAPPSVIPATASAGPKAPPETVRIDVHGIPAGTEVTLDGAPSALPVVVARGKDSHRIAVRAPDGTQQSVDVDGTRDRVLELVLPPSQTPPRDEPRTRGREPGESSRRKNLPARNGPPKKSPGARRKDLDAITDV